MAAEGRRRGILMEHKLDIHSKVSIEIPGETWDSNMERDLKGGNRTVNGHHA